MCRTKLCQILIDKLSWNISGLDLSNKEDFSRIIEINTLNREKTQFYLKDSFTKTEINSNKSSFEFIFKNLKDIEKHSTINRKQELEIYKNEYYCNFNKHYTTTPSNLLFMVDSELVEEKISISDNHVNFVNYNNSSTNKISKDEVFKMIYTLLAFSSTELCEQIMKKILSIKLTNKDLFTFGFLNQISIELLSSHKINYTTRKFIQKLFSDINLNALDILPNHHR